MQSAVPSSVASIHSISRHLNQQAYQNQDHHWAFASNNRLQLSSILNMDYQQGQRRPTLKKQLKALTANHPLVIKARQSCYPNDVYLY